MGFIAGLPGPELLIVPLVKICFKVHLEHDPFAAPGLPFFYQQIRFSRRIG